MTLKVLRQQQHGFIKIISLTLSRGCWQLTIHIVDLKTCQVFGCAGLGGRKQRWVMNREVTVIVL